MLKKSGYVNMRICMNQDCRKYCHRSNRFRLWRFVTEIEKPGLSQKSRFQKCDVVLCTTCFNNRQLGKVVNIAGGVEVLPARIVRSIGFK